MGRNAGAFWWVLALQRLEAAAERFYGEVLEVAPRDLQNAVIACRRSHEWRAIYLSDWLHRQGVEVAPPETSGHLYGVVPERALRDATLLLWTMQEGEDRGRCTYRRLGAKLAAVSHGALLQYLEPEQARIATITERLLSRRLQPPTREDQTREFRHGNA